MHYSLPAEEPKLLWMILEEVSLERVDLAQLLIKLLKKLNPKEVLLCPTMILSNLEIRSLKQQWIISEELISSSIMQESSEISPSKRWKIKIGISSWKFTYKAPIPALELPGTSWDNKDMVESSILPQLPASLEVLVKLITLLLN